MAEDHEKKEFLLWYKVGEISQCLEFQSGPILSLSFKLVTSVRQSGGYMTGNLNTLGVVI